MNKMNLQKICLMALFSLLFVATGCKDYKDDISRLDSEMAALKTELSQKVDQANTNAQNAIKAEVDKLNGQLNEMKEANKAALADYVKVEVLNAYKSEMNEKFEALKKELNPAEIAAKFDKINKTLAALGVRADGFDKDIADLKKSLSDAQKEALAKIEEMNTKVVNLETRTKMLEELLQLKKDEKTGKYSSILDNIKLNADKIAENSKMIKDLQSKLSDVTDELANIKSNYAKKEDVDKKFAENEKNTNKKFEDVAKQLEKLNKKIDDLKAELTKKYDQKIEEIEGMLKDTGVKFDLLSRRLTSLVAITDYYFNGVQTWKFNPLKTACLEIVPNLTVKYHVNPSTVTLKDIDADKIKFNIIKAKEEFKLRVDADPAGGKELKVNIDKENLKIENGILYVSISIPDVSVFSTITDFYKLAIQVPVKEDYLHEEGSENVDPYVTSDYVRISSKPIYVYDNLWLFKKAMSEGEVAIIKENMLARTISDAEAQKVEGIDGATTTDPAVINLPYGESLDLKEKIIAGLLPELEVFDLKKYDLEYHFDLNDPASGDPIVYLRGHNKTDQQKFINLEGSVISAKTFSKSEIEAAQGRTPIVHIYLLNKKDGKCHILDAFVKIHILDKPLPPAINTDPFDYGKVTVDCDKAFEGATSVKFMNEEVYTKAKLSKIEFHKIYKLSPETQKLGVEEIKLPDDQQTDTYILQWTISNDEMWSKLGDKESVTIEEEIVYKSTMPTLYGDVKIPIKITLNADKKIAFTDANLVKNYWYADKDGEMRIVRHNIAVPESGETNSANAIFKTSLLNPFVQFSASKEKKLGNDDNYVFTFYKDQPELKLDKDIKLTVSADGKSLMSGTEVVAKILDENKLELQNDSEVAKSLLNVADNHLKMRIGIMYYPCGMDKPERAYPVQVNGQDYYTIEFRKPIYMLPNVQDGFRDGVNFGEKGSWIDIAKLANLYDWRNNDEAKDDYSFVKYPWFYDYYAVDSMKVDTTKVVVNINGIDNWEPITNYPQIEFKSYVKKVVANGKTVEEGAKYGYMTYRNNDNNVKAFSIKFPLIVTYKWGKISTMVEVPVNKTVNSAPTSVR